MSDKGEVRSDIEIARAARTLPVGEIGAKLDIPNEHLFPYGHDKAKIGFDYLDSLADRPDGKLILVTAITPTPAGEGKTTTTVGLGDGLNRIGKRTAICLREPSLGPCFGIKGGAAGGGYAQVVPMESINLHFTGDFHAIGAAHNLLSAMVDNHIHWGNALGIDVRRATWGRVVDMNDRALRNVVDRPRRGRERVPAPVGLRHHGRVRGDGDLLPRGRARGPRAPARQRRGRADPRARGPLLARARGGRRDDRALEGRAHAEPRPDPGEQPRVHPRRAVREHRPRLQLRDGDEGGAQARRLRGDRGRVRGGPRGREVLRHQVPEGGLASGCCGGGRDHPGPQDARRGRDRRPRLRERGCGSRRTRQLGAPPRQHRPFRRAGRRRHQPLHRGHRRRARRGARVL